MLEGEGKWRAFHRALTLALTIVNCGEGRGSTRLRGLGGKQES